MVNKDIIPAVSAYIRQLSETVSIKKSITSELPCETEMSLHFDLFRPTVMRCSEKQENLKPHLQLWMIYSQMKLLQGFSVILLYLL